jgi:hypothetical protein
LHVKVDCYPLERLEAGPSNRESTIKICNGVSGYASTRRYSRITLFPCGTRITGVTRKTRFPRITRKTRKTRLAWRAWRACRALRTRKTGVTWSPRVTRETGLTRFTCTCG